MYQLEKIENEVNHVNNLRSQLIQVKKLKLHTGLEGFESPKAYGIYRNTGGQALGVVGEVFEPMNLNLFLDAIVASVEKVEGLDITKLTYHEYKEGAKVSFQLPLKRFELQTPMVGDILNTKLMFNTGFDGLTKANLNFFTDRVWCANGASSWMNDIGLSFKNTHNNHAKSMYFVDEIIKATHAVEHHVQKLNEIVKIPIVSQSQIDKFLTDLTGYDVKDYKNLTTRKRNILDAINESVAIENQNTGNNMFSLLQGITRYTTHKLGKGDIASVLFDSGEKMNRRAHQLVFSN